MNPANSAWPLDDAAHLAQALREQGLAEAEIAETAAALLALTDWPAPVPTPDETRRLVERLLPTLPRAGVSPVRQALRAGPALPAGLARLAFEFWFMLRLVRAQVGLLLPSFWLASAVVAGLGAPLVWVAPNLSRSFLLYVVGPLLAYIGAANAFRASGLKMLEFELACPPSPRQLTLARLTVVLSYDLALGLLLSLLLWPSSGASFWLLSLHWLAPLLLGVGLTLLLSLRVPTAQAAAAVYGAWVLLLAFTLIGQAGTLGATSGFSAMVELALGLTGFALIVAVILLLPRAVPWMLPRGR